MIGRFAISRGSVEVTESLTVTLSSGGATGWGEAAGVDYLGDDLDAMIAAVERVRPAIEAGVDREGLAGLLPPGGARNAIDCAMWDLEAKLTGRRAWEIANVAMGPVRTMYTIGIDSPDAMARSARAHAVFATLKIKLGPDGVLERLRAVRAAAPESRLVIDPNQSWTRPRLDSLVDDLHALGVEMIEQPLPAGSDGALAGYTGPVPLGADESFNGLEDIDRIGALYSVVNIKLDKCGGLTEALRLVDGARAAGLDLMVGNMCGSSLAMAPAMLVAQSCRLVDIDGPLLQQTDRSPALDYAGDRVSLPDRRLWG
jgi:L-alanine-DL-glutamate epimerase-like enolase superfamily enzyme